MKIVTLAISVCIFNDGTFEVILRDDNTGREVTLSGQQKLSDEEFDLVNKLAPSCVFTKYTREGR